MSIRVALQHKTRYRYDRPVQLGPQTIRLRPAPHCRTPIHDYTLQVAPENHTLHWQQDPQSNYLARVVFPAETTEFTVRVDFKAEMVAINPFDFFLEPSAAQYPFTYDAEVARELCAYVGADPAGPQLTSLLSEIPREPRGTLEFLVDLNNRVAREIGYLRRLEPGIQTTEETVALRQGSCRDSAWLLVQIARQFGISGAIRFRVSDRTDGSRFRRAACLGRNLPAGRRLGGLRPDIGPARGGGPHSIGVHRGGEPRGAD